MEIDPFAYAKKPIVRKHAPAGYENYRKYKPWLRDEFCFRCVYCLERELWYPSGAAAFSIDHVIPQSVNPKLVCVYENLVYACSRCNSWRQDVSVIDPTQVAFADHLRIDADGTISALSVEGQDLIDLLDLGSPSAIRLRKKYLRTLTRFRETPKAAGAELDFFDAFGFPSDLPNLSACKPPSGNAKVKGLARSYFRLRQKNKLPKAY